MRKIFILFYAHFELHKLWICDNKIRANVVYIRIKFKLNTRSQPFEQLYAGTRDEENIRQEHRRRAASTSAGKWFLITLLIFCSFCAAASDDCAQCTKIRLRPTLGGWWWWWRSVREPRTRRIQEKKSWDIFRASARARLNICKIRERQSLIYIFAGDTFHLKWFLWSVKKGWRRRRRWRRGVRGSFLYYAVPPAASVHKDARNMSKLYVEWVLHTQQRMTIAMRAEGGFFSCEYTENVQ